MGSYRWLLCPGSSSLLSVSALLLQPPDSCSSPQHPRNQPSALTASLPPSLMRFFFNWKKQKLQSPQAGRHHIQPCVPASRRCSPPLPLCAHQTKQRLLMLMLLGQSGLTLPLLLSPLLNSITQPPRWEQHCSDHRPEPPPAITSSSSVSSEGPSFFSLLCRAERLSPPCSHSDEAAW